MDKSELYQAHLDRVSRSFAFCIRQLKEPLRHRVALAYLLFRTLDTVEDATYENLSVKLDHLRRFEELIQTRLHQTYVSNWMSGIATDLPEGEKLLFNDSPLILEDLHGLPPAQKKILQEAVMTMSRGMTHFLKKSASGQLTLTSLSDVNRYCFFVAGIVGEMLTRLVAQFNPDFTVDEERLLRAHHFGLFLQKINLLKDRLEDQKAGRQLIPPSVELWATLEENMKGALEYLVTIPVQEKEYRTFCAWSLFLGMASIPWIKKSWSLKIMTKIPRAVTGTLLEKVSERIDDNQKLREFFEIMKPLFPERPSKLGNIPGKPGNLENDFPEFVKLYDGSLPPHHLVRLSMIGAPLS